MVKTTDAAFAEEIGVETYPALVFFKEGVPNLYEGDLTIEEEVLDKQIRGKSRKFKNLMQCKKPDKAGP